MNFYADMKLLEETNLIEDHRGYNTWVPGGRKNDIGKSPLSLISRRANEVEGQVLAFGAKKYDPWNWAEGMKWSRVLNAALRHLYAFADREDVDPESGLSHLAHARCCVGFLLDYEVSHPELDDRRPRPNLPPVQSDTTIDPVQVDVRQLSLFPKL